MDTKARDTRREWMIGSGSHTEEDSRQSTFRTATPKEMGELTKIQPFITNVGEWRQVIGACDSGEAYSEENTHVC